MWKMQKMTVGGCVVLSISGRIEAEELVELQEALSCEETAGKTLELDLQNVKLVGQQVITFLARCQVSGTRLRNCPLYIREWIAREETGQSFQKRKLGQDVRR